MLYNKQPFQLHMNTAGKITILTAFVGVLIFTFIFLLNIGTKEFKQATADNATTSVVVLNTPPSFNLRGPFESPESSTSTPTNAGDQVTWVATADDPSFDDYYLLVCDGETASPTAHSSAVPTCGAGDKLWGVSSLTTSGSQATVSTTTTSAFAESNNWFAWVCDSVAVNPRCNAIAQQGTGSTSSPFNVNHRPTFSGFWDDSPADPGATFTFYSTSTDSDTTGTPDTVKLFVCNTNSFSTTTDSCNGTTIATSTFMTSNASTSYTIGSITQDDNYPAYGFVIDSHGFEASGGSQGTDSILTVNNVTPTINGGDSILNGGLNMTVVEGVESSSTAFTIQFIANDNNSCDAVGGGPADEITGYTLSVYRSGIGSSTCDGTAGAYNANNCYPSRVATTTWNLSCTASSTSCTGATDATIVWDCTFPLWYIADPTDAATQYSAEDWRVAVSVTDDDSATSTFVESTTAGIEVNSLLALNLVDLSIPYGALEPGTNTGTLSTTTNVQTTGNTGLDEALSGQAMCNTYTTANKCANSATSTIPETNQQYATSAVAYGSGIALSSSTPTTLNTQIPKSTSTTTPSSGNTYWGIAIPGTITFAGSYKGENTFTAVKSATTAW